MEQDSRIARLGEALARRPAWLAPRHPRSRDAAVALLLRPRAELELLLIKRAQHESDPWSGHMALPGGRRESHDQDLLATALRETREEVGIDVVRTASLGALDEVSPQTPRLPPIVISPFVLVVDADAAASPAPEEVEIALWVPLRALADDRAADELILELEGMSRSFPAFRYGEHVIWGLTHRILQQFLALAAGAGVSG